MDLLPLCFMLSMICLNIHLINGQGYIEANVTINLTESCNLTLTDSTFMTKLKQTLDMGEKLLFISVSFQGQSNLSLNVTGEIFQPKKMIRIRGKSGQGLLWLREQFVVLSLTTLKYGIAKINVSLTESPVGCFTQVPIEQFEIMLMQYIVNDFSTRNIGASTWNDDELICNKHVKGVDGKAHFHYHCCRIVNGHITECAEITKDIWINVLLTCIVVINVAVVLYLPLLVPRSLYRAAYGYMAYEHFLLSPVKLKILKTRKRNNKEMRKNMVDIAALKSMPNFYKLVNEDNMQEDEPYEMNLNKINIKILKRRLIPENYVPVGIFSTIYQSLFRCKIRKKTSIERCCTSGIFCSFCGDRFPWYKCLRRFMSLVAVVCLGIPWVIRILMYIFYEHVLYNDQREITENRNLSYPFPGSFTLLVSPFHTVFVICYALIIFDVFFLGVINKEVAEKFKYILKKCFRDMRDKSRGRAMGWVSKVLLKPFEKFGLLGCVIGPIYWIAVLPLVLKLIAFYFFPTVNLIFRLLAHLIIHLTPNKKSQDSGSREKNSGVTERIINVLDLDFLTEKETLENSYAISMKNRCIQLVVISICLFSVCSIILLVSECIAIFVEVVVYTLIGIILNASITMRFISLIFMVVLYARDCFGSVTERYLIFNKTIASVVVENVKDDVENVSWQTVEVQKNTAFQLNANVPNEAEKSNLKLVIKNGVLKWKINKLILFLDKHDTPYITHKFFFDSINMPCSGCPGPLPMNLFSAISQFMIIIVFLLFVSLVVFAFGEVNEVSGTNQTMATLAGGFLPFVFTKILLKRNPDPTVNTGNVHFRACLSNLIQSYQQTWPVGDIGETTLMDTVKHETIPKSSLAPTETEPIVPEQGDSEPGDTDQIRLVVNKQLEYLTMDDYDLVILDSKSAKSIEQIV